jgi:hypothetical protein
MIAEYLEHALQFERFASLEENPKLKSDFATTGSGLPQAGDRTHQKARQGAAQNFKPQNFKLGYYSKSVFTRRGFNLHHGRAQPTRATS